MLFLEDSAASESYDFCRIFVLLVVNFQRFFFHLLGSTLKCCSHLTPNFKSRVKRIWIWNAAFMKLWSWKTKSSCLRGIFRVIRIVDINLFQWLKWRESAKTETDCENKFDFYFSGSSYLGILKNNKKHGVRHFHYKIITVTKALTLLQTGYWKI